MIRAGARALGAWRLLLLAAVATMPPSGLAVAQAAANVSGIVTTTTGTPVASVQVSVSGRATHNTSSDSLGNYHLSAVPAGEARLLFRKIGFEPQERVTTVPDSGVLVVDVTLIPVPLEAIQVQRSAGIPSFDEHRRIGLGSFFTREQLVNQENRRMADILAQVRGIKLRNGRGGHVSWVYSSRRPVTSIRGDQRPLDPADVRGGADPMLCYAQIFLDKALIYRGDPGEPLFNINSISPHQVQAIEYYAGPSVTPAMYARLNSHCGVLVIHTSR